MNKLQYDSFYKFLVSLGMFLIALPVLAFLYILNSNVEPISQNDYNNLSDISLNRIQTNSELLEFAIEILPKLSLICLIIGLILIITGCYKWFSIQKELDSQIKSDTIAKRINATQLSSSETVEKATKEISAGSSNTNSIVPDKIIRYMQVEDKCYNYFSNKFSNHYIMKQNLRLGGFEYDMVALHKRSSNDLIFEIKYWTTNNLGNNIFQQLFFQVNRMNENYKNISGHKCSSIIVIVAPKAIITKIQERCLEYTKTCDTEIFKNIDFEFIAEEVL